jgi:hypothetical protein
MKLCYNNILIYLKHVFEHPIFKLPNDINNFKKNKASNLVQNLIKQKLELEKKINGLVDNPNVSNNQTINMKNNSNILIENDKTQNSSQQNSSQQNSGQQNPDINAIRKKKNFARRF